MSILSDVPVLGDVPVLVGEDVVRANVALGLLGEEVPSGVGYTVDEVYRVMEESGDDRFLDFSGVLDKRSVDRLIGGLMSEGFITKDGDRYFVLGSSSANNYGGRDSGFLLFEGNGNSGNEPFSTIPISSHSLYGRTSGRYRICGDGEPVILKFPGVE